MDDESSRDRLRQIEEILEEHFDLCANPHETIHRILLALKVNRPTRPTKRADLG
jgi:hypothetical protein